LEALARDVKAFGILFRRYRVARLVVGDAVNQTARLILGIAARDGIDVDEFPNGMFLAKQQMDARVGDGIRGPLLKRFLAWGESNDRWLVSAGKGIEHVRVGYPLVGKFRQMRLAQSSGSGHALVLPLHVDRLDIRGLYGEVFSTLCETVRALGQIGFRDIRVKVHPGHQNVRYYSDALKLRSLECDIIIDGPLLPHLDWADIVVGPVNSGAMVETLALGRPYYPMRNVPSSLDPYFFCGVPVYESTHGLKAAIAEGKQIDAETALEVFAGYDGKRDPADAIWNAIAAGCAAANSQLSKG
jgi:hypothetical protein